MSSTLSGDAVVEDDDAERSRRAERYRRHLVEALAACGRSSSFIDRPDPNLLVNLLFCFLLESCGEEAAQYLFTEQGRPKDPREKQNINNDALLDLYDLLKQGKEFRIMRFVRDQAKANERLPSAEQHGAGSIDSGTLYRRLRQLLSERTEERRLLKAKELKKQREAVDVWRRKLAEVSAAFDIASRKVFKNVKTNNQLP